jgi:glycosyltransferase involved in cell wall biosynthesis
MGQVIDTLDKESLPYFSIVVPTKDRPDHLKECLDSILNQSFDNYEVILVNDGEEFEYPIPRFQGLSSKLFLYDSGRKGVSAARNTGMNQANGLYLIFLDDDEYFDRNHLLNLHEFYSDESNKNSICKTGTILIKVDGTKIKEGNFTKENALLPQVWKYGASMSDYCFPSTIKEKIQFEYKYPLIEDFIFLNKALTLYSSKFLNNWSVLIEDHDNRISYIKFKSPRLNFLNELAAIEDAIAFHFNYSKSNVFPLIIPLNKIIASTYVYSKHAVLNWELRSLVKILCAGLISVIRFSYNLIFKFNLRASKLNKF